MLVALGECYEKLNQLVEAKKVLERTNLQKGGGEFLVSWGTR